MFADPAQIPVYGRSFLCAGCGLGEGHAAPVYAKVVVGVVFAVKQNGFDTLCIKDLFGALGASWCLLGASWVLPGCLLSASWVLLGCLSVAFWCLWVDLQVDIKVL